MVVGGFVSTVPPTSLLSPSEEGREWRDSLLRAPLATSHSPRPASQSWGLAWAVSGNPHRSFRCRGLLGSYTSTIFQFNRGVRGAGGLHVVYRNISVQQKELVAYWDISYISSKVWGTVGTAFWNKTIFPFRGVWIT